MLWRVWVRTGEAVKVCSGEFRYGDVRPAEAVWVRLVMFCYGLVRQVRAVKARRVRLRLVML